MMLDGKEKEQMVDHIHKYTRVKLGKKPIYKCALVGCTHFIQVELVEGRNAICNRCECIFPITKRTLKNCPAKPHCERCYKKKPEDISVDEALDELLKEG